MSVSLNPSVRLRSGAEQQYRPAPDPEGAPTEEVQAL